jgi:hypothetical protein
MCVRNAFGASAMLVFGADRREWWPISIHSSAHANLKPARPNVLPGKGRDKQQDSVNECCLFWREARVYLGAVCPQRLVDAAVHGENLTVRVDDIEEVMEMSSLRRRTSVARSKKSRNSELLNCELSGLEPSRITQTSFPRALSIAACSVRIDSNRSGKR